MSRWTKGRSQNVAVPLETLIREKENANRPSAARSAGTVGKWGVTSFTSIRSSSYGLNSLSSYSPKHESADCSPQSGEFQLTTPTVTIPEPPKLKKFFKSRNAAPEVTPQSPQSELSPQYPTTISREIITKEPETIIVKISKIHKEDTIKLKPEKTKIKKIKEKPVKPPVIKSTKIVAEKVKIIAHDNPNKRSSTRTKNKIVNYNEVDDEDGKANRKIVVPLSIESPSIKSLSPVKEMSSPVQKSLNSVDHPPIVLRISKGTSRLISTDSEDVTFSPTHQNQQITSPATVGALSSTAELLAVLSDNISPPPQLALPPPALPPLPPPPPVEVIDSVHNSISNVIEASVNETDVTEVTENTKPPESIKIKIKTNNIKKGSGKILNNFKTTEPHKSKHHQHKRKEEQIIKMVVEPKLKSTKNVELSPVKAAVISGRVTRASRRQQQNKIQKCPSPLPGTDNYELYRTLASPSDKDFDSQSSVLGSISSKETIPFINNCGVLQEDSRVIHSRGSSDLTSDFDTSQSSILVAPPSDTNVPMDTIFESEIDDEKELSQTQSQETSILNLNILSNNIKKSPINKKKVIKRIVKSPPPDLCSSPLITKDGRVTRNNNNGAFQETKSPTKPAIRSYSRKRKNVQPIEDEQLSNSAVALTQSSLTTTTTPTNRTDISSNFDQNSIQTTIQSTTLSNISNNNSSSLSNNLCDDITMDDNTIINQEYKIKNKYKRSWFNHDINSDDNSSQDKDNLLDINNLNNLDDNNKILINDNQHHQDDLLLPINDDDNIDDKPPSVKLVISKKKGSIFKSRALIADQESNKKRHIYKHKWDDDTKDKTVNSNDQTKSSVDTFFDDFTGEPSGFSLARPKLSVNEEEPVDSLNCDKKIKTFVTVRNVKKAHQIQEIGEFQEMDDDVEYLLDSLQPHNPISTRCLSAIQLAQKCMTPAFRMHVRAHGTVTKFFKALQDATKDQSLGLCTATVMFVLSQDNLNMDLDRDSLGLMLNLLESDVSHTNMLEDCGLSKQQLQRNLQKVRELCEEIKGQGKAQHLNLDNITVGTLAMETLLSLTSKRAGEWFKEELRELGGLEHIINTICDCCYQISDYVVQWTDILLEKLRKIERCLRVLENVTQLNEQNQNYILSYNNGNAITTLIKLYKLCDTEIALYPTNETTPKDNPGVVIREALVPTLKVLINLTHPFNEKAIGSAILGEKIDIFDSSLHLLLQASNYVPEQCIFELSILVLLLLINLTMHTIPNRTRISEANVPSDFGNKFIKVPAIKALVEYFYRCDEMASQVEQKTDAILDNPSKLENKSKTQEEVQQTVTKLLQKAGNHMEHTMLASYDCILIGHLVMGSDENEKRIREYLQTGSFQDMIKILEKYYNFMNLTASSEASVVAHIKSTKKMIEHLRQRDSFQS